MTTQRNWIAILVVLGMVAALAVPVVAEPQKAGAADKQLVNVNTADTAQLEKLPRIGPKMAQRILEYRKANGGFKKPQDLMKVKGIGQKVFDLLKDQITI